MVVAMGDHGIMKLFTGFIRVLGWNQRISGGFIGVLGRYQWMLWGYRGCIMGFQKFQLVLGSFIIWSSETYVKGDIRGFQDGSERFLSGIFGYQRELRFFAYF